MTTESQKEVYYRAVKSRDPRFDGRIFIGVKTTGIYCRPVCPAQPQRKNMMFFYSSHEAEVAGFRPCLRCRPEAAPQSPAWMGKQATVKRAMSLIAEGALHTHNEKQFALKLGVSERHLRRLFQQEIGMTAKQISDIQRLDFARTLIVETPLPVTQIALSSGFHSLRRFNDAFLKRFHRSPSQVRRQRRKKSNAQKFSLRLKYRPPFQWSALLDFLDRHRLPGIEEVRDQEFHRLFFDGFSQQPSLAIISHLAEENALRLDLYNCHPSALFAISRKVRRIFDLNSDPHLIQETFAPSPLLRDLFDRCPGLRLPLGWNAFETAVTTILGQLVSVEQARKLAGQLISEYGTQHTHSLPTSLNASFPSAKKLSRSRLTKLGTTAIRKQAIRELAKQTMKEKLSLSVLGDQDATREALSQIKGLGPWSTEYICLRALGDTDAFPAKDLILARATKEHPEILSHDFRPWRSYLAIYLWQNFAGRTSIKDSLNKKQKTRKKKPS